MQTLSTWLLVLTVWIIIGYGLAPVSSQCQAHRQYNVTLYINSSMTLQQAVNFIAIKYNTGSNRVQINVPSGQHKLTSQILFPSEVGEIEFAGLESNVFVSCAYDMESNYTWYFDHLSSVTIRGIHFENCPRPLRLDTVCNVTIQNCSFR